MSAPTLWEEGQMSGSRVTRLAVLLGLTLAGLDLAVGGHLSLGFDIGFVLICLGAALAVHPRDFFRVGVLPPLLLLGLVTLVAVVHRGWVAEVSDSVVQAIVSGLALRANSLMAAYAMTLGVLAMRQRVRSRHLAAARTSAPRPSATPHAVPAQRVADEPPAPDHSNLEGSPAPTRVTSGAPSEKSTTGVGSEPHSPGSMTASNQ